MRTSLSVLALILMAVSGMPSSAQTYVATDAPGQAWGGLHARRHVTSCRASRVVAARPLAVRIPHPLADIR